jgi:hypothetical protein
MREELVALGPRVRLQRALLQLMVLLASVSWRPTDVMVMFL